MKRATIPTALLALLTACLIWLTAEAGDQTVGGVQFPGDYFRLPNVASPGAPSEGVNVYSTGDTYYFHAFGGVATEVGVAVPSIAGGRLTLSSTVSVTADDQTAKVTLYYLPHTSELVSIYSGSAWAYGDIGSSGISIGTGGLASSTVYDVFVHTAGSPSLELLAWTDATTRATAIVRQDGVWVKSGATTRRYLGTVYTDGATQFNASENLRHVFNAANRVNRTLVVKEATDSWVYTTAAFRQANGSVSNQVEVVRGLNEDSVSVTVRGLVANAGTIVAVGVGISSSTTNSAQSFGYNASAVIRGILAHYVGCPGVGFYSLRWLEYSQASGATTWRGDAGAPTTYQAGMTGTTRQ